MSIEQDPETSVATTALAGSTLHRAGRDGRAGALFNRRFGATTSLRNCTPPSVPPDRSRRRSAGLPSWLCSVRKGWSGRRESNPRHSAWEADVLPLNYGRIAGPASDAGGRSFASSESPVYPVVQPRSRRADPQEGAILVFQPMRLSWFNDARYTIGTKTR